MKSLSLSRRFAQWLLLAALMMGFGLAMAQSEPNMSQIYATAKSGKLEQAQVMIQQVLVAHPKSANAHYVRAELYARQGDFEHARESLATAEKLAPGLPRIKPESVQALRAQLSARHAPQTSSGLTSDRAPTSGAAPAVYSAPAARSSSFSWGLPLMLAGVVIIGGYFLFRRRDPAPAYSPQGGLSGPQTFGGGAGSPGYPQYPQPGGYPAQQGTGLGGRIMGGVATGLAVGAGVVAAEAIGRSLMGDHNSAHAAQPDNFSRNDDYQPFDNNSNADMGGASFGVNDGGSWDDGGGSGDMGGGGGDWDN